MTSLVKVSAQVTPEFRRVLRQYCAEHGITIRELIVRALEYFLSDSVILPRQGKSDV